MDVRPKELSPNGFPAIVKASGARVTLEAIRGDKALLDGNWYDLDAFNLLSETLDAYGEANGQAW